MPVLRELFEKAAIEGDVLGDVLLDRKEKNSRALATCAKCGSVLSSDAERVWCPECKGK